MSLQQGRRKTLGGIVKENTLGKGTQEKKHQEQVVLKLVSDFKKNKTEELNS